MQNFILTKDDALNTIDFVRHTSEKDYVNCIQSLIKSKPFGDVKFYIFSFFKRVDDVVGAKKMYHQPRLTKPEPVPGTTLMRVDPNDPETATIIWTLPNQENFGLYKKGKMFSDPFVFECIKKYQNDPLSLMGKEEGDLSDEDIQQIYIGIAEKKRRAKNAQN